MRIEFTDKEYTVVLSRKNLETLLADLGKERSNSISKYFPEVWETVIVKAEEDDIHYVDRQQGSGH